MVKAFEHASHKNTLAYDSLRIRIRFAYDPLRIRFAYAYVHAYAAALCLGAP